MLLVDLNALECNMKAFILLYCHPCSDRQRGGGLLTLFFSFIILKFEVGDMQS